MALRSCAWFLMLSGLVFAADSAKQSVTYSKDVAPILFKNCATCHRAGEIGPMPLLNYQETRPWAKSIRQAMVARQMPPWYADPQYGHFANDTRLSQKDVDTITKWVDDGAPQGNATDLPPAPKFTEGWVLGKPDLVIEMPEAYNVPAEGVIPYQYFTAHTGLAEDKYVRGVEIRPGNRAVVHHIILNLREAGASTDSRRGGQTGLGGTAPGLQPKFFPDGIGRMIKAGSDIVFQMHYTPNGRATTDRSYVGLYFSKEPPREISRSVGVMNFRFQIPAGDPNYEVTSTWTAPDDIVFRGMMPHMHVRGKDFKFTATYPDGRSEVLLNVPRYDFNWQLNYTLADPIHMPKGTRIDCVAHYDNSANNKYNPDPTKVVRWGDQTWEEMMIGFFDYTVDRK